MSIIGPRPLLVSYLPWYTEEEKQRHDVRPGLSGLAQVNGRNSVTWEEKFSWDLKYVDRITFLGDVKITLDTVKKAFIKVEGVELNHEGNLRSYDRTTMKKLVFREKEFSFYLFNPDFFHLYDKEKKGRCEPVHRYTLTHILHQYVYLIGGVSNFLL